MKTKKLVAGLLTVLTIGACVGTMVACSNLDIHQTDAVSYVSLRINPEIDLLVNEDGKVIEANAINDDGEVVLSEVTLEGKTVEQAAKEFVDEAYELGFLTPGGEKDTVYVGVESALDGEAEELENKINKSIGDYFNNKGINGKISKETLEKYLEKAQDWNVSVGHMKLIMRALDLHPELSDEDVVGLDMKSIMNLIKTKKGESNVAVNLKNEYKDEVAALKDNYKEMFDLCKDVDDLKDQLKAELSEEEIAEIEQLIVEKEAALKEMKNQYKDELSSLKESYKSKTKEAKKGYSEKAKKLKEGKNK